ncbi:hypothetical protein INT48_003997, partial [Thamnidium elegans]
EGEKAKFVELADDIDTQQIDNKKHISKILQKLQLLPFRKLKFSVKLYVDQNVQKSVKKLQSKFGSVTVLILGDWSAPNTKYQEPTRNKGLIKMLKKNETAVYIINEFRTSFAEEAKCDMSWAVEGSQRNK